MNWRSTAGKSGLVKMLMQERGFSKRKAEKAVKAVFMCMTRALWRGERVELPVGWIWASARPTKRKAEFVQNFRNIADKTLFQRFVKHPKRFLHFRPNPPLIERGPFPPPPASPESLRKAEEVERQFCALMKLKREMSLGEFQSLLAAADNDLDRLDARLRQLLNEGRSFDNLIALCSTVRQLYWIRK